MNVEYLQVCSFSAGFPGARRVPSAIQMGEM
jgi:hypothetical protein